MVKYGVLPSFLKSYLWDIEPDTLDLSTHATFVIERLLDAGDEEAVRWLFATFPRHTIADVVKDSRRLSQRSAVFWSHILDLPADDVRCLSKSFQKTSRVIWTR